MNTEQGTGGYPVWVDFSGERDTMLQITSIDWTRDTTRDVDIYLNTLAPMFDAARVLWSKNQLRVAYDLIKRWGRQRHAPINDPATGAYKAQVLTFYKALDRKSQIAFLTFASYTDMVVERMVLGGRKVWTLGGKTLSLTPAELRQIRQPDPMWRI